MAALGGVRTASPCLDEMLREFIAGKKKDGLRVLVDNYPWDDWLVRGLKPVENRHLSVVIHPSSGGRWWPVKQNKGRASTEALGEHQEAIRGDLEDALALVPPGKERTGIMLTSRSLSLSARRSRHLSRHCC